MLDERDVQRCAREQRRRQGRKVQKQHRSQVHRIELRGSFHNY
jgi:hypothetical protein